jgi:RNA polymerase sigma factor (sigma-70 family)
MDVDDIAKVIPPSGHWTELNDEELLIEVAAGDSEDKEAAFNEFYNRHATYLYSACERCLGQYGQGILEVDDIFTITMQKACKKAHTFRSNGDTDPEVLRRKVRAWLGTIAENVLRDRLRSRLETEDKDPETLAEISADDSRQVDSEEIQLVRDAIQSLNEREQQVIWAFAQFYRLGAGQQRIPSDQLDELVRSLRTTKENLRQIRSRGLRKIKQYVEANTRR